MPNFFELLQVYLVPFAIAVPIGLLLIFFGTRRGGETRFDDIADEPARPAPPAPSTQAPPASLGPTSLEPALLHQPSVDIPLGATTQFHASPSEQDTIIDIRLANAPGAPRPPKSILVVDDSAVPRIKLRKLFEAQGYQVETANDGVQAMEAMGKRKFSVVITDLEMPNMDGFELIAAIQGSMDTEDIPVIAITGHEEMQARVHNIQGLYGIFKKPWNDRELLKRVDVLASIRV